MLPEAKAVIDAWAEQGRPIYERMVELGEEAVVIANRSRAYSPRDVPSYEDVKGTLKALTAGRPPLPLPALYVAEQDEQERRLTDEDERIENPEAEARPKPRRLILRRRQPVPRSPSPSARRICRRRSSCCCCWSRTSR